MIVLTAPEGLLAALLVGTALGAALGFFCCLLYAGGPRE